MTTAAVKTGTASGPAAYAALGKSNIIAVASGKGGVGKTWFSITLAHALAKAGHRTLLFDGDLGLANIDVQLGMTPRRDLGSVIAGQTTMAQAVDHYAEGGFDIIAGRNDGTVASKPNNLSIREYDVALSIVHVAKLKGWKKMVREHTDSGHIPEILVWKPKADAA